MCRAKSAGASSQATVTSVTAPLTAYTQSAQRQRRDGSLPSGKSRIGRGRSTTPGYQHGARKTATATERESVIADVVDQVRVRLDVERAADEERHAEKDPTDRVSRLAEGDDHPDRSERRGKRDGEGGIDGLVCCVGKRHDRDHERDQHDGREQSRHRGGRTCARRDRQRHAPRTTPHPHRCSTGWASVRRSA